MTKGIVSWFNDSKGYGFIKAGDKDVFVHYSRLDRVEGYKTLQEGQEVEFEMFEEPQGPKAFNVAVLKGTK